MRICSFPECGRKHFAKGLCNAHYNQKRRGKELGEIRPHGVSRRKPSTFPKLSIEEIIYLSAWIDAEGCLSPMKSGNGKRLRRPCVGFSNTDKDIVDRIYCLTGCINKILIKKGTGKQLYQFRIVGNTAIDCMKTMMPWLSERRRAKVKEVFKECGVE